MTNVREQLERAIALEQRGERAAARRLYEQVLAEVPEHPGALLKIALFEQAAGELGAAHATLERALRSAQTLRMATAPIRLAFAGLAESANDPAAARAAYQQALAEAPGHPAAAFGLGRLALRESDFSAATKYCRAGLAVAPAHAGLLTTLGHALRLSGALAAAADALGAAAAATPDDAAAWLAFGNVCMEAELAQVEAARGAVSAAGPPQGTRPLGGTARSDARGDHTSAAPNTAAPDLLERAIEAFGRAAALQPETVAPHAHLAMAARYACAWPRSTPAEQALLARHAADAAHFVCSPMMAVALLSDPAAQRAGIGGWSRQTLPPPMAPNRIARRGNRLRVGYLSSDFHDHATAHLMAGLFECHDQSRIETFAYASDRDDGSAMRQRLRRALPRWRDIRALADDEAARHIGHDALDVLVDLKGHTHGTRIAVLARRPAPVQLHYLGFPGTIAYDAVDGFVADDIVAPAGCEPEFAELLLRLPVCYQVNDAQRPLPAAADRSSVGLPERALVLACFNQTYKVTEPFVSIWLDVLRERPDAVLWLWVPHALARRNLRAFAEAKGVASERIVFAPVVSHAEHLARLRCADLALDVLPYGSHTSGSDALWAGVPLLTCRGTTFAGRVGASLCHAAGLPELVTESLADYAAELRRLCGERDRLEHLRRYLDGERERLPLFDTETFTRAFERLLEAAANGLRGADFQDNRRPMNAG